jgi:hypothetical protein
MPIVSGLAKDPEHHIAFFTVTGVILPSCKAAVIMHQM